MAGRYGMSFAKELIEDGQYEEAVEAATKAIDGGDAGPEPLFDRATALDLLERSEESLADFVRAIEVNLRVKELDAFALDDAFFGAAVECGKRLGKDKGLLWLGRYRELLPTGAHAQESRDWEKRLRGELPSLLDKTKDF